MTKLNIANNSADIELLSFQAGGQRYAIDIGSVREIKNWVPPSELPNAPCDILGVINLRGEMLPLMDLAAKLGLSTPVVNERSVIIVAELEGLPVGLLVDAVSDIVIKNAEEVQPPPEVATSSDGAFVQSLTAVDGEMVRILEGSNLIRS